MSLSWCPDTGYIEPLGEQRLVYTCLNFFPTERGGYVKCLGGVSTSYTTAVANYALGSARLTKSDGTERLFVGSQKRLEEANGAGAWTDRSNATTYSATDIWTFAQFGDDTIACSKNDPVQVISSGADFADLGGSPPKAKFVVVQSNVVMLLNINDGTDRPDWWASSDQNSDTTWTASATNFADKDRLYGGIGGPITAATAYRDEVIAWKKNAMYRGRFTGDLDRPWIWDFVSTRHGCPAPFGHVETENGLVFITERDVMIYDGSPPRSIADQVRKTLFARIGTHQTTVFCTVDEPNACVYFWFLFASDAVSATPHEANRIAIWNYKTGEWGFQDDFGTGGGLSLPSSGIRNLNYASWTSSGIAGGTNTAQIANVVVGGSLKLFNMTGGFGVSSITATLGLWPQGNYQQDAELRRLIPVMNPSATLPTAGSTFTASVIPYDKAFNLLGSHTIASSADRVFDLNKRGRFFDNAILISGTNYGEILRVIPEYVASGAR